MTFSVALLGEVAFWSYCLKAVSEGQRLTALAQAAYLLAHTLAGFMGDLLLHSGATLMQLQHLGAIGFVPQEPSYHSRTTSGADFRARNGLKASNWT